LDNVESFVSVLSIIEHPNFVTLIRLFAEILAAVHCGGHCMSSDLIPRECLSEVFQRVPAEL
jgi:hypothetical protein